MASSVKKKKSKIISSNYKNSWLLECNDVERSTTEKQISVRWCLEHGADANVMTNCGSTALHAATRRAEAHIVHLLIKYKANVNTEDCNGETPLHLVMRYGDGTAHILEPVASEVFENNREEDTPRLQEAATREVRIIDMLLGSADTNKTDNFGDTPLHVAVRSGEAAVVFLLLQHGADVNIRNSFGETALHLAAHRGEAPIFKALLGCDADVNTKNNANNTPLHLAAHRGEVSVINMLLNSGADVKKANGDGDTPLHLAIRSGKTEAAGLLLRRGADVNKKNSSAFSPLHVAADAGEEAIVNFLLDWSADVNATNDAGNTPLHLAVLQGQETTVNLLLNRGVDVNITNTAGDTSLYLAVLQGDPAIVELLLRFNADVNTTSSAGNSPLHVAAYLGKEIIVGLLLNSKADVNKPDSGGNTALHVAARRQQVDIVRLLVRYDADVTVRNSEWNTPLTVARVFHFEGNDEIVNLLQNAEKPSDSLALMNYDQSQSPSDIYLRNNLVAIPDTNSQIDTPSKHLQTDIPSKFPKKTDTSGLCGQLYESKLLTMVLLRALNDEQIEHFLLGTNINGVGDMDDICMRYRVKGQGRPVMMFVQAKHREDREKGRLTVDDVRSVSGDYSLRKYFDSYLTLKDRFQAGDEDPMFEGDFKDVECNLIIYTPAKDYFTKKNTNQEVSKKVHYLIDTTDKNVINTRDKTVVFQYKYDEGDIEYLNKITIMKRLKKSGAVFLEKIMSETKKLDVIMVDKQIARFHVVMGREVLKPCENLKADKENEEREKKEEKGKEKETKEEEENTKKKEKKEEEIKDTIKVKEEEEGKDKEKGKKKEQGKDKKKVKKKGKNEEEEEGKDKDCRIWEFRPEFFESNNEYLLALKESFVKELSSKRYDQSDITKEDQDNFRLVLQNPDAVTISKLIGKLATYNDRTKKLKLVEISAFQKKFKTQEFKELAKQFNEIEVHEDVISEAIQMKLKKMKMKLPLSFGNLDMTFRGNETKIQKRIKAVVEKLIELLTTNSHHTTRPVLDITDDAVGPGKIEQGFIDINGGIGGAVGNLLILDPVTNTLKLDMDNEKLPTNADLFLKELKDPKYNLDREILRSYRINIEVDGFPKDSLNGDLYGEKLAREYLSKLWFYTDQAKQNEVEDIIKDDIDKYYNNEKDTHVKFKIHSDAIFRSAHGDVQDWWKKGNEANYLTRKSDFFEKAKLDCFNNLLLTVIKHIYESKIYNIDFKFNPQVQQSDACIEAPAAIDVVFGQQFKIFDLQNKRINTDGSQKMKDLVQYAEKLANYYVAASSDPYMIENILTNKESQGDIVINILQNNVEHEFEVDEFKYSKRTGTSAMSGQLYETKLLCLVLIRALNDEQIEDFFLATNIRGIGDMDDICLRYRVKNRDRPVALFLQAKHKDNGNLTVEDVRNPLGEFSLQKYFKSYLNIRNRYGADAEDPMFKGDFGDIDWNFIIYTSAKEAFRIKKTEHKVSEKVHFLISTNCQTVSFQYEYDESDIETLSKILVLERLKKLGVVFLDFILFIKDDLDMLIDKLIAQYHVVLGREVLQPCAEQQAINEYRMWEFRPEFFTTDCEYLNTLKKTFVHELSTKCWDQFKVTNEDRNNFMSVLEKPCSSTISKLIGKMAIFNTKSKKLQLVASFRKELMSNVNFKKLAEQFNEIETNENVINEAIKMRLETMTFKLPLSFGNLDMTLPGSETSTEGIITELADNIIRLLEDNKDKKVVNINNIKGTEKNANQDIYSCIESALGNLLVLDPDSKMLKFDSNNEALADNAALFLKVLKEDRYKPLSEELNSFRIKINIDEFPKVSFHAEEYDEIQVKDFLNRLWFYADQAKEDEVELILKVEINRYYSSIGRNCSAYFGSLPELVFLSLHDDMQKWWMQTSESPYLTRASELFERAKDSEISNLLETVINFMFISNTSSVDIKFKQRVSSYFKFVKMHQIFNKMSATLFSLFDRNFRDTINIELPVINEPVPYSNYSSLGELAFSLEIQNGMEWVVMKMWAASTFNQYFLLAKGGPGQTSRSARDGFLLQQLCNGRKDRLIKGERDPNDMYSFVTTRFN